LYYYNNEYRIEEFFEGRPMSIFEMRNSIFLKKIAETICDYHENVELKNEMEKMVMKDEVYFVKTALYDWGKKVKARLPKLKENLKDSSNL
jgi:hypothetical protein